MADEEAVLRGKCLWTEKLVCNLLSSKEVPEWWNPDVHYVTYDLLDFLFSNFHKVSGSKDDLISSSINCLNSSVSVDEHGNKPKSFPWNLPKTFKNLDRKVKSYLSKKEADRSSLFPDFYVNKSDALGEICSSYNITKSSLTNFFDSSIEIELPDSFFLSNGLALEIFSYHKKSNRTLSQLVSLFSFLSGGAISEDCDKFYLNNTLKKLYEEKRTKQKPGKAFSESFISQKFSLLSVTSSDLVDVVEPQILYSKIVEEDVAETKKQLKICKDQISSLVEQLVSSEQKLASLTYLNSQNESERSSLESENINLHKKLQDLMTQYF